MYTAAHPSKFGMRTDVRRLKDRTYDATLCAMAEFYRVSTFAVVACNIARNVAGVNASSTSATLHATTAALHVMV